MNVPNPAQATGPMTLESGLASLKAKMAERGAKADDLVRSKLDAEGLEMPEETQETIQATHVVDETANEETTETVSENESEAETQEPDNRPVILPDGSEITVEEARKGYLRHADFTRKTQDVAREREAVFAEKQAAVKQLNGLYQQLASLQETEPDWNQVARDPNTDPKQLIAAQAYWQQRKATMNQAREVIQNTQRQAEQSAKAKAFHALNSGEYEPTWKDAKALKAGLDTVSNYLADTYNMPGDVISSITDPAAIIIADKARKYDELQKQKPKAALAVKGKPVPFKPGAKSTASPESETLRLLTERFTKNPTSDNAFALEKAKRALRR